MKGIHKVEIKGTESFIEEDVSYAKIVEACGEDTTEWHVESVNDKRGVQDHGD